MAASALFKKTQNKAGLALHEDDLRYIELEGNLSRLRVAKKVSVPSGGKGIRKNSLADAGDLLAALQALGSSIGISDGATVTAASPRYPADGWRVNAPCDRRSRGVRERTEGVTTARMPSSGKNERR